MKRTIVVVLLAFSSACAQTKGDGVGVDSSAKTSPGEPAFLVLISECGNVKRWTGILRSSGFVETGILGGKFETIAKVERGPLEAWKKSAENAVEGEFVADASDNNASYGAEGCSSTISVGNSRGQVIDVERKEGLKPREVNASAGLNVRYLRAVLHAFSMLGGLTEN